MNWPDFLQRPATGELAAQANKPPQPQPGQLTGRYWIAQETHPKPGPDARGYWPDPMRHIAVDIDPAELAVAADLLEQHGLQAAAVLRYLSAPQPSIRDHTTRLQRWEQFRKAQP